LASRERVLDILKAEFREIKEKFGDDRRTAVELQAYDMQIEDLIPEEDNVVTITNTGYIKRLPVSVYRKQRRGGKGVTGMDTKEEDYVVDLFVASTHDFILFFSSKGKVFKRKAFKLPAAGRYARGKPVVNLLERLEPDEKVESMALSSNPEAELLTVLSSGYGKRTTISEYRKTRRGSKGVRTTSAKYAKGRVVAVKVVRPEEHLLATTKAGVVIRCAVADI